MGERILAEEGRRWAGWTDNESELLTAVGTRGMEAFPFSVGEGMSLVVGSQQAQEQQREQKALPSSRSSWRASPWPFLFWCRRGGPDQH